MFFKVLWRPKILMKCKSGIGRNISMFLSVSPSVAMAYCSRVHVEKRLNRWKRSLMTCTS